MPRATRYHFNVINDLFHQQPLTANCSFRYGVIDSYASFDCFLSVTYFNTVA